MDPKSIRTKTFRDRFAIFSVSLMDGTKIIGQVVTIDESLNDGVYALNMRTTEGENLIVPMNAVSDVTKYISDDPQDYRHFMSNIDKKDEFWTFELVSGDVILARVLHYMKTPYGTPLTLLLFTENDEMFEIPWTAVSKIR